MKISVQMTMILAAIVAAICFSVAITGFTSLDHITDPTQLADAKGFAWFWTFLASLATAFGVLAWWIARTSNPTTVPRGSHMRNFRPTVSIALLAQMLPALAADVDFRVIASGEVKPGVYGRVEIGSAPPPPLVYTKPVVVIRQPKSVKVQPVYVHVPPGHAKQWSRHCRKYDLCGVPVYFVKSEEYKKPKKEKKD